MIVTRIVSSVIASPTDLGSTIPVLSTGRYVTLKPFFSRKPERSPDAEVDTHNWWNNVANLPAEDSISVGILQVKHRDFTVTKLEQHTRTAEMLVSLKGNSILVVGKKSLDNREIERMEAFYLTSNQIIILNVDILHFVPFPLEDEAIYAVVFRSKTPEDDLEFIEFKEDINLVL